MRAAFGLAVARASARCCSMEKDQPTTQTCALHHGCRAGARIELIVLDELGYVPLPEIAAGLLVQVIADCAEKAAIIVTTKLRFSEGPQVFTNARLCKAMLDRLTDQAHIMLGQVIAAHGG